MYRVHGKIAEHFAIRDDAAAWSASAVSVAIWVVGCLMWQSSTGLGYYAASAPTVAAVPFGSLMSI